MDRFAFIIHPLDPKADVARKYPLLARFLPVRLIHFLSRYWPPLVLSRVTGVRSPATGREVEGFLLACPLTARQMLRLPTRVVYRKIIQTGRLAERLGARILGLGAYTSVVGDGGLTVARALEVPMTSGDSYTVAVSVRALLEAGRAVGVERERAVAAVVGATGAIGSASARWLARMVPRLILVARREEALRALAGRIAEETNAAVTASTRVEAIADADLILTATSAGRPLIFPEHLKPGAVVCDVARPRDVSPRVLRERKDVLLIDGGLVKTPEGVDFGFDYGLPLGLTFACMAETIALTLEGRFEDYTVGKELSLARIAEIDEIARRHGFRPAGFFAFDRPVEEERLQAIRRRRRGGMAVSSPVQAEVAR